MIRRRGKSRNSSKDRPRFSRQVRHPTVYKVYRVAAGDTGRDTGPIRARYRPEEVAWYPFQVAFQGEPSSPPARSCCSSKTTSNLSPGARTRAPRTEDDRGENFADGRAIVTSKDPSRRGLPS